MATIKRGLPVLGNVPSRPKETRSLFKGREWMGTAVLVLVPMIYILGFLAWAWFAAYYGLGFLVITAPRYLAAGTAVALMGAVTLFGDWLAFRVVDQDWKKKRLTRKNWNRFLWHHSIGRFMAFLLTLLFLLALLPVVPFLRMEHWQIAAYLAGAGVIAALFNLISWRQARKSPELQFESKQQKAKAPPQVKLMSRVCLSLIVFILFAVILFPSMRSEFGAPEPRIAKLDLDPSMVSKETQERLWPAWKTNSQSIVRTPEVRVLLVGDGVILLRSICEGERSGALFVVDVEAVQTVVWIGEKIHDQKICDTAS